MKKRQKKSIKERLEPFNTLFKTGQNFEWLIFLLFDIKEWLS
jgi:hypothetical protein